MDADAVTSVSDGEASDNYRYINVEPIATNATKIIIHFLFIVLSPFISFISLNVVGIYRETAHYFQHRCDKFVATLKLRNIDRGVNRTE